MKRLALSLTSFSLAALCCFCLLLACERQAHAYIDPGSGLLALQSGASVVAALGYFLRRRIRALFGRKSTDDVTAPSAPVPVALDAKDISRAA